MHIRSYIYIGRYISLCICICTWDVIWKRLRWSQTPMVYPGGSPVSTNKPHRRPRSCSWRWSMAAVAVELVRITNLKALNMHQNAISSNEMPKGNGNWLMTHAKPLHPVMKASSLSTQPIMGRSPASPSRCRSRFHSASGRSAHQSSLHQHGLHKRWCQRPISCSWSAPDGSSWWAEVGRSALQIRTCFDVLLKDDPQWWAPAYRRSSCNAHQLIIHPRGQTSK